MLYLRENTASQEVMVGPFVDSTDGVTPETGLSIANTDCRIHKATASTFANKNSGGGTHIEDGYYLLTLNATDTNTGGLLRIQITMAGALPVLADFMVLATNVYDSWAGNDTLEVDVTLVGGSAEDLPTATALATVDSNVDAILVDTGTTLDGKLNTIDTNVDAILVDTGTTLDGKLNTIDTNVDAILVDTAVIGVAGAGLTALATQASVDTVDSNVDAILVDTAEIGAAGAGLTALATQASVNTVDSNVDAILVDTAEIGAAGAGLTAIPTQAANVTQWAGTTVATPATAGVPSVDTIALSGDTTAADNIEAMYDGTGYTDELGPASRSQVDNLGSGSGGSIPIPATTDNTLGAIIDSVTFVGSVSSGTIADLQNLDGVPYAFVDSVDVIDVVFGFQVGGGRQGSEVRIDANVDGNADEMLVKVYDHVGAAWDTVGTIEGTGGGTAYKTIEPLLFAKHTGTGSELGMVYVRFDTDSTTPSLLQVDQCVVLATNTGHSVGYQNGSIWLDTVNGTAGTESFVNGVADNPSLTLADALTLETQIGVPDLHVFNGSALTLAASMVNKSIFGDNYTLALGGQDISGMHVEGAAVSGIGTAPSKAPSFEGCNISAATVALGHFDYCGFDNTFTAPIAGDYLYHNCYATTAGGSAPIFTKTAGQTITGEWRNYRGDITLSGIESGDVFTIDGMFGPIILNGADGTVHIRGSYESITDNRTGSPTLTITGAWQTEALVDAVWDEPFTEPSDLTWAGATPRKAIGWLFGMFRNKATLNRTTGAGALRNDADSADLATWTVTDASSITTDGEKA